VMATPHPIPKSRRFQDLTGKVFGYWTVLFYAGWGNGSSQWWCRCACGHEKIVLGSSLRKGSSTSCRCRQRTHGLKDSPEWQAWQSMKTRCLNPNYPGAHNYSGREITVCAEWLDSFVAFFAHVGLRPSPEHSLDRIDNERGYEPGNVRWATRLQQ